MSDNFSGLVPGAPFIPEQPPTIIYRQIVEWKDRADLAEHSFDGQWRVLCTYMDGWKLWERWVLIPDDSEYIWREHLIKRDGPCENPIEDASTTVQTFDGAVIGGVQSE